LTFVVQKPLLVFVVASSTESASFDGPGQVLVEPDFVLVATTLVLHH
jgi:hypothetical protein